MAEYIEIKGSNVPSLSSDPSNPTQGQVWYNTTSAALKGYASIPAGAWSAGGNLTSPKQYAGAAGTQTAGLSFGGSPSPYKVTTQTYDGTSWTEVNDLSTGRQSFQSWGTQTSAVAASGYADPGRTDATEIYDGTSWTTSPATANQSRSGGAGWGTSSSAGGMGGGDNSGYKDETELFNGTAWTEVGDLNVAGQYLMSSASGSPSATLIFGGERPSVADWVNLTESWDGTSWTEVNNLNIAVATTGGGGTQTSAICAAGYTGPPAAPTAKTETFDGTSWTEVADLTTARYAGSATGATNAAALYMGGTPPVSNATEEWSSPSGNETVTFTDS